MPVQLDEKIDMEFVYLVWGLTPHKIPELMAICTTEDKRDMYVEAGENEGRHKVVTWEKTYLDHLYGNNMLKLVDLYLEKQRGKR